MKCLSASQVALLKHEWGFWGREEQLAPENDWRAWLFMGGRGSGKTRAGAEWVAAQARGRKAGRIALIGPTFHDVREVMVEGQSGLRALGLGRPTYEASRKRVVWANGAQAYCFSAEDPESLRGPQFDAAWCDELCYWAYPDETLSTLEPNARRFERDPVSGDAPILHVKLFNPTYDWYGLSPIEAVAFSIDRWDDGNVIRIKLYGGALASVAKDALLDGANAFAIESDGEWEVVQVRQCALVAPNEYELRRFLRGQLGSAHAMRAPHPVGARVVKLDDRLARLDVASHEWREAVGFLVPPAGGASSDPRAATLSVTLPHAAARPWAPAHLRARRAESDDIAISWVRCARSGDTWGAGEPPLGAALEAYRLDILDGATVKRSVITSSPGYGYTSVDQIADFGAPPALLRFRVAQIGPDGAPGLNKELTIAL
jgi:hypothetical protein